MKLSDFRIGLEFLCGEGRWRCTDVGTRVVVAIRIDRTNLKVTEKGKPDQTRTLDQATAEAEGWFDGPPYAVLESVFDEDDLEGCEPLEE